MSLNAIRIAMWSGPRNISTALMRAWENRDDCTVWDEPLYGFYLDATDAELTIRYELEYRPLSQRYLVRNLSSGDQDSFATLYSALNNLGRVQGLPVIDDALLEADKNYRVRLRALLSTRQYSAPLRLLFFWRDQWQLTSEWFEWSLER